MDIVNNFEFNQTNFSTFFETCTYSLPHNHYTHDYTYLNQLFDHGFISDCLPATYFGKQFINKNEFGIISRTYLSKSDLNKYPEIKSIIIDGFDSEDGLVIVSVIDKPGPHVIDFLKFCINIPMRYFPFVIPRSMIDDGYTIQLEPNLHGTIEIIINNPEY